MFKRFDEPPPDLNRMACCLNALIEVFDLKIDKLQEVNHLLIVETVKKIARYNFTMTSEGFVSILIQDIIDLRCKSKATHKRVMELCSKKFDHYLKTRKLI
jgi:hypothetical protein